MAGDRIEREVLIAAPVDVVWEVISRPEHIVHWLSDEAQLALRPGEEGVLNMDGTPYDLRFETVEPPHLLSFRWVYPRGEVPRPGNSTVVAFTLTDEGGQTRLTVVENGLDLMPWPDDERQGFVESHSAGWTKCLERLAAYAPTAPRPLAHP
ncbi:MAG: SRPBCC domain-containing protein [Candidatus Limnocylindrales bacterium]